MLPGLDVSHWQGIIDWAAVKTAGYQFAFIKATDGDKFTDSHFGLNWSESSKAGIPRGAYHFFRPEVDFEAQFRNFTAIVPPGGELPPCLDLEVGDLSVSEVTDVLAWLDAIERFYKVIPVLYVDMHAALKLTDPRFYKSPLWLAYYSADPPRVGIFEPLWTFWQHTPSGTVDGVPAQVDLDWFD